MRDCRASVIVPVHNEEARLGACLESLLHQTVSHRLYDVILLLNNCTDASIAIAEAFRAAHTELAIHCIVRELPKREANVGTARRLAMDAASRQLPGDGAILSTDGDTTVARDWVEANLNALQAGADLVGGEIAIVPTEYARLPESIRRQYDNDASYQAACTRLESLLDPDPFDCLPRHHHHFGASLACTNRLYRKVGGLPAVESLEDVAFFNAAVRADARVRHSPAVKVWTAARTSGRARVGFASQLREWEQATGERMVDSADFLNRYFRCRRQLRRAWAEQVCSEDRNIAALLGITVEELWSRVSDAQTFGELHDALDFRGKLWRAMPKRQRVAPIQSATLAIMTLADEAHPGDSVLAEMPLKSATPGVPGSSHAPHPPLLDSRLQPA